jgi:hypothetical protein
LAGPRPALLRDLDLLGEQHRQLIVRHLHQAVLFAVNHGDRSAPVTLAAYAPVLDAEGYGGLSKFSCCGNLLKFSLCIDATHPVVLARVHQHAVFRDKRELRSVFVFNGLNHLCNRQAVLGSKLEVPLIVRWNAHDCAGAVIGQNVVCYPDRHPLAVIGIDGKAPGRNPVFLDRAQITRLARLLLLVEQLIDLCLQLLIGSGKLGD